MFTSILINLCNKEVYDPTKVATIFIIYATTYLTSTALSKQLSDTVKMIAYRAETAMVSMLRKHLNKEDEARALVRALFVSSGDIEPNEQANTLTVNIHRMATPAHDKALGLLLTDLTNQGFCHPETAAKMIFRLV